MRGEGRVCAASCGNVLNSGADGGERWADLGDSTLCVDRQPLVRLVRRPGAGLVAHSAFIFGRNAARRSGGEGREDAEDGGKEVGIFWSAMLRLLRALSFFKVLRLGLESDCKILHSLCSPWNCVDDAESLRVGWRVGKECNVLRLPFLCCGL